MNNRVSGIRDVPQLSVGQERFIRGFAIFALLFGVYWLYWRWTATLNPDAMVFSLLLVLAETWGVIGSAFFLFNAWRIPRREPPPPKPGRTVDVFVTTYDEPLEVLRRTAIGARAIRYPHRTYILDDGKRDEVQRMAEELGIGYIRRQGNESAKAGNLNQALKLTSGEFVLQLDTDHVPLPNIIHRLIGYFDDPKVAFVQTPQDFYNTDSFTHVVNDDSRSMWEENRIFYSLLQPGKDHWNASFFCGCGGMLRRSALEEIGGFSTNTIIEDMETSLMLHRRGHKSVYHPEALAFGLSPESAGAFHVQRLRWAQGSMQLLRKFNPLMVSGLTVPQRICYFAANVYPIDGLQKLIFYLSPVIFLLTGIVPIRADTSELMLRLVPYLIVSILSFELVARGTGYIFIAERYNMAKFFTYIVALTGYFARGKLKFNVTPKGVSDVPLSTYAPQLALLAISLFALFWAPLAYGYGWINYNIDKFDLAFWFSAFWVCWNVYFAASVVRFSLRTRQQRGDHRFVDDFPVRIRVLGASDAAHEPPLIALTRNLNPSGVAFRSTAQLEPGTRVEIALPLSSRTVTAQGEVVHVDTQSTHHGRIFIHGVRFDDLDITDRDAIEIHCTHHAVPIWRMRYRQSLDFFARAGEVLGNARRARRYAVQLPALIRVELNEDGAEHDGGLLEEISTQGARLLLDNPLSPGTRVAFEVPGTSITGAGEVVFSRALESPMSVRFTVGMKLDPAHGDSTARTSSARNPGSLSESTTEPALN